MAASRGVDVGRAQRIAFLSASLATGAAISMAGPIGFIGIVVPAPGAAARGIRSPDRAAGLDAVRRGVPGASAISIARTIMSPIELPVGIVTAMIGGPFFLWLLVRKHEVPQLDSVERRRTCLECFRLALR